MRRGDVRFGIRPCPFRTPRRHQGWPAAIGAQLFPRCASGATADAAIHGLADDLLDAGFELPSVCLLNGQRLRCHAARGYFQVVDGFGPGIGVIGRVVGDGVPVLVLTALLGQAARQGRCTLL